LAEDDGAGIRRPEEPVAVTITSNPRLWRRAAVGGRLPHLACRAEIAGNPGNAPAVGRDARAPRLADTEQTIQEWLKRFKMTHQKYRLSNEMTGNQAAVGTRCQGRLGTMA